MKSPAQPATAILDLHPPLADFHGEFIQGVNRQPKEVPCKYLYDAEGSALFEEICELPEYYPTRTELGILSAHGAEIAGMVGEGASLVELGSGSARKIRVLLDRLPAPDLYVPVDISRSALVDSAAEMRRHFPDLTIFPVCADYTVELHLPELLEQASGGTLLFFPGSTIGNFEPKEAAAFLRRLAETAGPDTLLLIGADLKKDPQILEAAYNDSRNVTARFNLNMLARANRELGAKFDLKNFRHRAVWNDECGRIEMHLISCRSQVIPVNGSHATFAKDEILTTEHSYKYEIGEFQNLARSAGFEPLKFWTDAARLFSVHLFVSRKAG